MKKIIPTFFLCFLLTQTFGQHPRKVSTYLWLQYDETLYDRTLGNNSAGLGFGLQTFIDNETKFKPTIELTADYYAGDKAGRVNPDGTRACPVTGMASLYAGSSYHPVQNAYLSFVVGPSFMNNQTLLGIKPSVGIYFSEKQRWTVKCSYINIFNRGNTVKEDFGIINLAIGLRLF